MIGQWRGKSHVIPFLSSLTFSPALSINAKKKKRKKKRKKKEKENKKREPKLLQGRIHNSQAHISSQADTI